MNYTVDYSKHATLQPGVVDHIFCRRPLTSGLPGMVCIINHDSQTPLYFDYTYPDNSSPRDDITPREDNTFVVTPGSTKTWIPTHVVDEFTLIAETAVSYSVMLVD